MRGRNRKSKDLHFKNTQINKNTTNLRNTCSTPINCPCLYAILCLYSDVFPASNLFVTCTRSVMGRVGWRIVGWIAATVQVKLPWLAVHRMC